MAQSERNKMSQMQTNMRILKPSRKKNKAGSVFVLQMPDGWFSFGRLVNTDVNAGMGPGAQLIYVFKFRSKFKDLPERAELRSDQLLLSPIMTNRLPWSRGYFETIAEIPFEEGEILKQHCFRDSVFDRYRDEQGNELPESVEPVGRYGLHSFRTIDDAISKALDIPLIPEE
ncbi:MAG: Imm26 family immunity protein [Paenarthrobacter sp.]